MESIITPFHKESTMHSSRFWTVICLTMFSALATTNADHMDDWERLPKDKVGPIMKFYWSLPEDAKAELKGVYGDTIQPMLNTRIRRYAVKNFPNQAPLMDQSIWYGGVFEDSKFTFFELFRSAVLNRNPDNGMKLTPSVWFVRGSAEKFTLHLKMPGEEEAIVSFEMQDGRLWATGFLQGAKVNPSGWQVLAKEMFEMGADYPKSPKYWDFDFIDSL